MQSKALSTNAYVRAQLCTYCAPNLRGARSDGQAPPQPARFGVFEVDFSRGENSASTACGSSFRRNHFKFCWRCWSGPARSQRARNFGRGFGGPRRMWISSAA